MILKKIYEDFLVHTDLKDSIYKTVFIQISDVLAMLNKIKWIRLKYVVGEQKISTEFLNIKTVPLYILEIIQNLFYQSFTFPENCRVELVVELNGIEHHIISENNVAIIPKELSFIKDYNLLQHFFVIRPVFDIFSEFDSLFSFTDKFKTKVEDIYKPLEQSFLNKEASEEIDAGMVSKSSVADKQSLIEVLKKRRTELINTIAVLTSEIEATEANQKQVSRILKTIDALNHDKKIVESEYHNLKSRFKERRERFDEVLDVLSSIQVELEGLYSSDAAVRETDDYKEEVNYLLSKKELFDKEKIKLEGETRDLNNLIESTKIALNEMIEKVKKANEYGNDDVTTLAAKYKEFLNKKENSQIELLSIENEIKQLKSKANQDITKIQSVPVTSNSASGALEETCRRDIVSHLSSSLQPNSITVVLNYLRYYFAFHVTRIAAGLDTNDSVIRPGLLQCLSTRLALVRNFGVCLNNLFSVIDIADNRIANVNVIEVN